MQKIVIICGQTATGKSSLAVAIAQKMNGEIISADSRQVYTELNVSSNKLTPGEMGGVPHHMMNVVSVADRFTVAQFQTQAREIIRDIFARGKTPIICGGTGLYIDAVLFAGFNFAHDQGGSIAYDEEQYYFDCPHTWIGLHDTREILVPIIACRAHDHYDAVISEITRLVKKPMLRDRLYGLGLEPKLAIDVIENAITPEKYINLLTIKTWQYAKRQMTWFKRNPAINWFLSTERDQAIEFVLAEK